MPSLIDIRKVRIEKLRKLRSLGINPFPSKSARTHKAKDVLDNFEVLEGKGVVVAGRIISWRGHGKIVFANISDSTGTIQLYIKADILKKTNAERQNIGFDHLDLLDIGDFVESSGVVTKTKKGEISVASSEIRILAKAVRPLPEKREGLKKKEGIFRRRYLDLAVNKERREMFIRKSKFWSVCRSFMRENGFLEVETPILEHVPGGADSRPFVTYHNALNENFYLRISPELYLKRLLGGGFEKIFVLGPNFRNEGIDDEHLQEFYALEWYWAYADYRDNMKLARDLIIRLAKDVWNTTKFSKGKYTFDLSEEWKEIDYVGSIKEYLGVDVLKDPKDKLVSLLKSKGVVLEGNFSRGRIADNLWKIVRKNISGPAFLVNEPKITSPLAKQREDNEEITERFHIIIAGTEIGNGYSELTDPFDQYERFKDQQKSRKSGDEESQMMDIDFVEMLEYGMPPATGYGQSERLFWVLEGVTAREGTLFPQMKRKIDSITKEIYGIDESDVFNPAPFCNNEESSIKKSESGEITKEDALKLLGKNVKDANLKRHMIAVSAVMGSLYDYFKSRGTAGNIPDKEMWEVFGLLHDADYELTKDDWKKHTLITLEWLKDLGVESGALVDGIKSHNTKITNLRDPQNLMEWSLECADELTGFIVAVALVKPDKKLASVTVDSVLKKWKKKDFAKAVKRDQIEQCDEKLGIPLNEFIGITLQAMQKISKDLGL